MDADERRLLNDLTERVLAGIFEVSNTLGAGFLEKVYERALLRELTNEHLAQCLNYLRASGMRLCPCWSTFKNRPSNGSGSFWTSSRQYCRFPLPAERQNCCPVICRTLHYQAAKKPSQAKACECRPKACSTSGRPTANVQSPVHPRFGGRGEAAASCNAASRSSSEGSKSKTAIPRCPRNSCASQRVANPSSLRTWARLSRPCRYPSIAKFS